MNKPTKEAFAELAELLAPSQWGRDEFLLTDYPDAEAMAYAMYDAKELNTRRLQEIYETNKAAIWIRSNRGYSAFSARQIASWERKKELCLITQLEYIERILKRVTTQQGKWPIRLSLGAPAVGIRLLAAAAHAMAKAHEPFVSHDEARQAAERVLSAIQELRQAIGTLNAYDPIRINNSPPRLGPNDMKSIQCRAMDVLKSPPQNSTQYDEARRFVRAFCLHFSSTSEYRYTLDSGLLPQAICDLVTLFNPNVYISPDTARRWLRLQRCKFYLF